MAGSLGFLAPFFWVVSRFGKPFPKISRIFFRDVLCPDPPTLVFFSLPAKKKSKGNPPKKQGFSLRGTPKILEQRKNAQKAREIGKKQGNRKKKARIGGPGCTWPKTDTIADAVFVDAVSKTSVEDRNLLK